MSDLDNWKNWVAAVSSSLIYLLITWPMRLGALLFVSMLDRYDTNRKDASFPFALASLMRSISGPFAGFFGGVIGLEAVTLLGCLFCTVGVGGCFFAEKMIAIDISFGIIYGIGFGWSTCLVPEILNRNFKKHRNKAYGVYFGAGGLGAFMSPPILEVILHTFGVSGTFLIMCGIILHSVPAAMLLYVPNTAQQRSKIGHFSKKNVKREEKNISQVTLGSRNDDLLAGTSTAGCQLLCAEKNSSNAENAAIKSYQVVGNTKSEDVLLKEPAVNIQPLQIYSASAENTSENCSETNLYTEKANLLVRGYLLNREQRRHSSQASLEAESDNLLSEESILKRQSPNEIRSSNKANIDSALDTNNVKIGHSDAELSSEKSPVLLAKDQSLGDSKNSKYSNKSPDIDQNIFPPKSSFKSSFRSINILWHPLFILISSLQGFSLYLNYLFWTITVDVMRDKGIEQHLEVYFVMCFALFDTAGRFFLGTLIDCGLLTVSSLCAACFAVSGFSCLLLTWLTDFYSNIAAICLLGLVFGGNTACFPGTITEFIHEERRAIAMSSRLIMYIPMSFTISPLIGYFRGNLGSYNGLLYVITAVSVICAILTFLLPEISKRRFCRLSSK